MSGGVQKSGGDRQVISLKLLVDKSQNRVIFAESDHELIDILFSFLTLPLGTVLRLIGCDKNLIGQMYGSVSSLETRYFRTDFCKSMLLSPRNASEDECSKLKININPSVPGKLYVCTSNDGWAICRCLRSQSLGFFKGLRCQCGSRMNFVAELAEEVEDSRGGGGHGVFTKGGAAASFMVTDDLQVLPGSTSSCIALLRKLGINDGNEVEERTVEIGRKEVLQLLGLSLFSKSPLTAAILLNHHSSIKDTGKFSHKKATQSDEKAVSANSNSMSLKLLVSKSRKRILYAEAGVDVVDFLFSFLTFPLGAIVKLLDRNSSLGCMDNLYKGAEDLSSGNYLKSEECKKMLVCPKLAPYFGFENHPLLVEEFHPQYVFDHRGKLTLMTETNAESRGALTESSEETRCAVIVDPKSPSGAISTEKGYLKGPAIFMITDNLTVEPLSPISSLNLLNQLKVSINDVEERVVTIGKNEALNLLKASLISKTALSDVFKWRDPYPEVMLKV